ncbi:hypothetical protein [Blastococcus sp. CCUG 61487]|uniref:hypothetical protein n=1 Tax=Blastococcus sp. CCUG 61487 TaxID=1840703 RepID=UPI0010BF94A4|nr:hypothetical protein [Blastococcus sp. CCUG 61487]TKJ23406.1 hypothetical protein A6V29_05220 [Blastococcus sp. CCUG 61487]
MQLTSSPRRALGLLAAGTVGLSTALLGVTGVAQAAGIGTPTIEAVEGIDEGLRVFVSADADGIYPSSWEYSLDGGTTPVAAVTDPDDQSGFDAVFEIDGLANGDEYDVVVRGVEDEDHAGPWSAPKSGTPFARPGVPGVPTVQLGNGTATLTWTAATVVGTYPIKEYVVGAGVTMGEGGGHAEQCRTAALTCTVPVVPGWSYHFFVSAVDDKGNVGDEAGAAAPTGKIPAISTPASVPAKNGDLTITGAQPGAVAPGAKVTVSGEGYAPGSTVSIAVYSTPQVLTTAVAGPDGKFSVEVTVPAGLAKGNHTLVASGVDASGVLRYVNLPITVSDAGVATVAAEATLAATGADVALPVLGGIVALGLGGGLIVVARRRAAA